MRLIAIIRAIGAIGYVATLFGLTSKFDSVILEKSIYE